MRLIMHPAWRRMTALAVSVAVTLPLAPLRPAWAHTATIRSAVARPMTTKQKVVLLAGAALLYYLYRKHQARQTGAAAGGRPQLYRSRNGGVYYRDPRTHQPIWLTVSRQPISVPAADVQQYAPDYRQYQGQPAPPAPAGSRSQPFSAYDAHLMTVPHGPVGPIR